MGFVDLLVVALIPVVKVLLVTGVGLFLAMDRVNPLGPEARHHLNKIVFYVFAPALVASNLAQTITLESFVTLWFMPVNVLITFIIGSAFAWLLIKITKTPKHLQGVVIGCCSAGNLGNLLFIIVPAVCEESNNPFGDSSTCSSNAKAYASLSMAIGVIYIWSYVYGIMRIHANRNREDDFTMRIQPSKETSETSLESCREALLPSKDCHGSEENSGQELPHSNFSEGKMISVLKKSFKCIKMAMEKINPRKVFAPSAIGGIVGFIIGTVSPIRQVLLGDHAPLRVIDASAYLMGQPTVTCMTLIMGANLLRGLKGSDVNVIVITGIIVVRNIFLPMLGIAVVKTAQHFGMISSDPLYMFVLMLQYALPPAMAVGTMTQLFQIGQSESSVIMLWAYAVASFFLTLWSTIFMWLLV